MIHTMSKLLSVMILLLFACGQTPQSTPVAGGRSGNERTIYKDSETGRTIWRMTNSQRNDKHCYYSSQPWSPDMSKILWSSAYPQARQGAIYVMDADGSNIRLVLDEVRYNMHTGTNAVWSKDGSTIYYGGDGAVTLDGRNATRPAGENVSYDRKVAYEKGPVRITNEMCYALTPHKDKLKERPALIRNPKWSPDGKTFMMGYSNEYEDPVTLEFLRPTVKELYLIDADGTNFRRLGDYGHHHSWTPDSKYIIYAGQDGEGMVVQAADASSRRVVSQETGVHGSMNPQGTLIVTDVYSGEHRDYLVLIHVETGDVERLVQTPRTHPRNHAQTHCNPSWSPDGSMVMYDNDESGTSQVYIVIVDEEAVRARFGDAAIATN